MLIACDQRQLELAKATSMPYKTSFVPELVALASRDPFVAPENGGFTLKELLAMMPFDGAAFDARRAAHAATYTSVLESIGVPPHPRLNAIAGVATPSPSSTSPAASPSPLPSASLSHSR